MIRSIFVIGSFLSLVACSEIKESPSYTPTNIYVPDTVTTSPTPVTKNLCISEQETLDESWPLQETMMHWNSMSNNRLVFEHDSGDCYGWIIIKVAALGNDKWGRTEFPIYNMVQMIVGDEVPDEFKKHVLCHELGHVLGLPHDNHRGCMNVDLTFPTPCYNNIVMAGNSWEWLNARRQSGAV